MQPTIADVNERGDVAAQIEQRVQPYRCLALLKRRPWEHGQGQIDRRGVERIDGVLQVDPEGFVDIQWPSDADQALGEVGVDAPIAHGVGIGQRVARHRRAHAEVVELGLLRAQARLDVAQALAKGQLRERHAQELIQAGERLDLAVALVTPDAPAKGRQWQMLHHLCEHQLPLIHRLPPRSGPSQGGRTPSRSPNRDQTGSPISTYQSAA